MLSWRNVEADLQGPLNHLAIISAPTPHIDISHPIIEPGLLPREGPTADLI